MDELGDDLLLLAVRPDGTLATPPKLRFGLPGSELARLAAGHHGGHGGAAGGHH